VFKIDKQGAASNIADVETGINGGWTGYSLTVGAQRRSRTEFECQ
jgi:hypothetical protein